MEFLSQLYKRYSWYTTQEKRSRCLGSVRQRVALRAQKVKGSITVGSKQVSYDGGNKEIPIEDFGGK